MTGSPAWAPRLRALTRTARAQDLSRFLPVGDEQAAAVLILFSAGADGEGDVLLLERAPTLRKHAGQVSFPGGSIDPGETVTEAALREAREETGLDPSTVLVWGELPAVQLPVTNFAVHPVLAWWPEPGPLHDPDPGETRRVVRVAIPELVDPRNRFSTALRIGIRGPAFAAGGLFIWGFTASLLSNLLDLAGLSRPWDPSVIREVPPEQLR
ncbi:MAG: NUDIX hydrolase [Actinomycetales bacterium]